MLAYVGLCWPMLAYVGLSCGQCGPSLRVCWPILRPMAHFDPSWATRSETWEKMGRAQNTVKRGIFWWSREVGGRGCSPSLLRRGENCRTAMPRPAPGPAGPWPDLSAYARQPARGPTMLAHLVAMLAYVGLCWPMLAYVGLCWPILRAMWAQLGLRPLPPTPGRSDLCVINENSSRCGDEEWI